LSPFATERLRTPLVAAFAMMHAGIGLVLGLGLFSSVCIAAWIAMLPTGFWERCERRFARRRPTTSAAPDAARFAGLGANLLAGCCLAYVVLWNVWSLNPGRHDAWFPFAARIPGYQLRIAQLWGMFSPAPAKHSSWLELKVETADGRLFWLHPDGEVSDRRPASPERALSERWRKFHERVIQQRGYDLDVRYASFLLKRFGRWSGGVPATVSIFWVRRQSPPPASPDAVRHEETRPLATASGAVMSED
ncbi:MAG: hypothetical protein ACREQQ_12430, partial [Candidatus Binatia bacterium]